MTTKAIPGRIPHQGCRVCLCSDSEACPSGCWWVRDPLREGPLCSRCLPGEKIVIRIRRAVANGIPLGRFFATAFPEGTWSELEDGELAALFIDAADELIPRWRDEQAKAATS